MQQEGSRAHFKYKSHQARNYARAKAAHPATKRTRMDEISLFTTTRRYRRPPPSSKQSSGDALYQKLSMHIPRLQRLTLSMQAHVHICIAMHLCISGIHLVRDKTNSCCMLHNLFARLRKRLQEQCRLKRRQRRLCGKETFVILCLLLAISRRIPGCSGKHGHCCMFLLLVLLLLLPCLDISRGGVVAFLGICRSEHRVSHQYAEKGAASRTKDIRLSRLIGLEDREIRLPDVFRVCYATLQCMYREDFCIPRHDSCIPAAEDCCSIGCNCSHGGRVEENTCSPCRTLWRIADGVNDVMSRMSLIAGRAPTTPKSYGTATVMNIAC
jgi:hypothetical protein